jgi:NADH dehydrogenase
MQLTHYVAAFAATLVVGVVLLALMARRRRYLHVVDFGALGKGRKHIVVLGGGFGGVYTAQALEKLLGENEDVQISLVNRENYFVFQPMLPEIVSGSIGLTDMVSPLSHLLPRTNVHVREVEKIDFTAKTVTLSPGFQPRHNVLQYDHLVFALGNVTDFRGLRGLPEHALPFKNLADALNLRNHIIKALGEAAIEKDERLRQQLLTFVVAGGGFSGVEVVAEINDFVRGAAPDYRGRIDEKEIRVILLHNMERILPEMDEKLAIFAQRKLAQRGVDIRFGTRLTAATGEAAILDTGERIETKTLVSTVPSSPHPLIQSIPTLPKSKNGKIEVDEHLQVKGTEDLWAVGDCAAIPLITGGMCPPTAQHASRQGQTTAENIVLALKNSRTRKTYAFKGLGMMGSLGHHSAVAQVFGLQISGFMAWLMWRGIYLMKLPGATRRARVLLAWILDYIMPPDSVQLKLSSSAGITQEHFEPGQDIFRQGDVGDRIYIILSGEADVVQDRDGKEVFCTRLHAGEFFGEMAVLNGSVRSSTVRCKSPMDALSLPKREFGLLTANLPELKTSFENVKHQRMERDEATDAAPPTMARLPSTPGIAAAAPVAAAPKPSVPPPVTKPEAKPN